MFQQHNGETGGIQCVVVYEGPDCWKVVIYAMVPSNLFAEEPVTKVGDINSRSKIVLTSLVFRFLGTALIRPLVKPSWMLCR